MPMTKMTPKNAKILEAAIAKRLKAEFAQYGVDVSLGATRCGKTTATFKIVAKVGKTVASASDIADAIREAATAKRSKNRKPKVGKVDVLGELEQEFAALVETKITKKAAAGRALWYATKHKSMILDHYANGMKIREIADHLLTLKA